jgi:integrase/recombinase XerC/integrase/recombinase XerD
MSTLYRRHGIYWYGFRKDNKNYYESLQTKDRSTAIYLKAKKDQELAEGKAILPGLNTDCLRILGEYQKSSKHYKATDSHRDDETRIRRFLTWSKISRLNQITEKKLQDYLNHRIEKDKISLNTANHIITNIKTWLNFSVRNHYIAANPLAYFKRYKLPVNPKRFLSAEEINKLLEAAKNPRIYVDRKTTLYPVIATAIYTGLRQRELFTLEWQDIDLTQNCLTVRNKEGFTTKSKRFRVIPLHKHLKAILKPYAAKSGRCFDITNQRRIFSRILRKAGLKDAGWHTLRHTCASHLAMKGVDLPTIAQILGHSSISTTMIYAHLTKGHIKGAIERLEF